MVDQFRKVADRALQLRLQMTLPTYRRISLGTSLGTTLGISLTTLFLPIAALAVTHTAGMPPVSIDISTQGNELLFDKKLIQVKANQPVRLTFHNAADGSSGLEHTWVLVKPGTQDKVATEAVSVGAAKNYIPDDSAVLAHTEIVKPGESQTIAFKAPSRPGKYPYICSFPAHSQMLKGVMEVK